MIFVWPTPAIMAKLLWLVFLLRSTLVHSLGTACSAPVTSGTAAASDPYWLENIVHQGTAAFNADPGSYTVFRNVMDFGAVGTTFPLIFSLTFLLPSWILSFFHYWLVLEQGMVWQTTPPLSMLQSLPEIDVLVFTSSERVSFWSLAASGTRHLQFFDVCYSFLHCEIYSWRARRVTPAVVYFPTAWVTTSVAFVLFYWNLGRTYLISTPLDL